MTGKEAERALLILQGYRPCPICNGALVFRTKKEKDVDGRRYHFDRACGCKDNEQPGYFSADDTTYDAYNQWISQVRRGN